MMEHLGGKWLNFKWIKTQIPTTTNTHINIYWFNLVKELFQSNSQKDNMHRNLNHHVYCMQYNIYNYILKHYAKGVLWGFVCLKFNRLNLHILYLIADYGVHTSCYIGNHWKITLFICVQHQLKYIYVEHHELTIVAKNLKIKSSWECSQWNGVVTNPISIGLLKC
jgi:hypothetical protein